MGIKFKSKGKGNVFVIADMETSFWALTSCLFSFFPLQELMYYSSYTDIGANTGVPVQFS